MLTDAFDTELTALAERQFRKVRRIPDDKSVREAGFDFPDNVFQLNTNYGLDSTGLFFHYNSYDISGWAAGPTKVTMPWAEVLHLIPPDTPLRRVAESYLAKSR
jgi:hypothetical protein